MKTKIILLILSIFFITGCTKLSNSDPHGYYPDTEKGNIAEFNGSNFSILPKNEKIKVNLSKNIDGDTARFSLNGHEFKTRFLLIDTPETVKQGVEPQKFGKEASERTSELLLHAATIEIEFDNGNRSDKYKRALCYVYVDNVLIQNILVSEGLARIAYINSPNDSKLSEIEGYELIAKEAKIGIWSTDNNGNKNGIQE